MRKHSVSARLGTFTAALSLALLAVACDRTSDAPEAGETVSIGSTGRTAAGAPELARAQAMTAQREEAASRRAPAPAPPLDVMAASAVANDSRALSLGSPIPPIDPSGAMLIRNGRASVQVTRLDDAVAKLRQTAAQLGGFVANTSIVGGREEHRSATLEIRVPSAQFDAVVSALGALGKVESVSATVQDVGDEYVDLGARVANARHMEARLVEMLARRTGKLSEALTVEQELRRVREEIERYDARLKWLERRTALSSLEITLHEPTSLLDQRGPNPIAEAFAEAWRRAVGVVAWGIAALGVLIPMGLVILGGVMLFRRMPKPGGGTAGS
jgi:hypothetical protein